MDAVTPVGQMVKGRGYTQPGGSSTGRDGARASEPVVRAVAGPVVLERVVVRRLVVRADHPRGGRQSHGRENAVSSRLGTRTGRRQCRRPVSRDARRRASRARRRGCSFRFDRRPASFPIARRERDFAPHRAASAPESRGIRHAFPRAARGDADAPRCARRTATRRTRSALARRERARCRARSAATRRLQADGPRQAGVGVPRSRGDRGRAQLDQRRGGRCNAVSLHSGLPISVVDLDRAHAPFRIGVAPSGSSYVFNASGQEIDLGGLLCLFDADGPCGNAVRDAQRTKTRDETRATLSVVWGCVGFETRLARCRTVVSIAPREHRGDDARRGCGARRESSVMRCPSAARVGDSASRPSF